MKFELNYNPEIELFSLVDNDEQCIIVIKRIQLEALIKLYDRCIGIREDGKNFLQEK